MLIFRSGLLVAAGPRYGQLWFRKTSAQMVNSILRILVFALAVAAARSACAVILVTDQLPDRATLAEFKTQAYVDNTPFQISSGAQASALFAGQGWRYSAIGPGENAPWESPYGDPTPGAAGHLELLGQYQPPATPAGSPPVTPGVFQNVIGVWEPANPRTSLLGGVVNGFELTGVTSFLFQFNIAAFALTPRGAGIDPNDGKGGPLWFAFFRRDGTRILCLQNGILSDSCYFSKATDTLFSFLSSDPTRDIAGMQVWHQDPRGLGFTSVYFTPVPATALLMFPALVMGVLVRRGSRSRRPVR